MRPRSACSSARRAAACSRSTRCATRRSRWASRSTSSVERSRRSSNRACRVSNRSRPNWPSRKQRRNPPRRRGVGRRRGRSHDRDDAFCSIEVRSLALEAARRHARPPQEGRVAHAARRRVRLVLCAPHRRGPRLAPAAQHDDARGRAVVQREPRAQGTARRPRGRVGECESERVSQPRDINILDSHCERFSRTIRTQRTCPDFCELRAVAEGAECGAEHHGSGRNASSQKLAFFFVVSASAFTGARRPSRDPFSHRARRGGDDAVAVHVNVGDEVERVGAADVVVLEDEVPPRVDDLGGGRPVAPMRESLRRLRRACDVGDTLQ